MIYVIFSDESVDVHKEITPQSNQESGDQGNPHYSKILDEAAG